MSRTEFLDKWVNGCEDINMHLEFLVSEKSDSFNIRSDCPPLKAIMDKHEAYASGLVAVNGALGVVTASALAHDELLLILKSCQMDLDSLLIWKSTTKSVEANAYRAMQSFVLRQDENASHAVDLLLTRKITLDVWNTEENAKNLNRLMDVRRTFASRNHIVEEKIPFVVLMNHSAPSCFPQPLQKCHMSTLSWCICDNTNSVGVLLMPIFSHQMNKKYLLETAMLTKLSKHNFSFDDQIVLLFDSKVDKRDARPLTYPGRLVFPSALGVTKSIWQSSKLCEDGRTDIVTQVHAKDMKMIEDVSVDALPDGAGTDHDRYVSGGHKYMQVGQSAYDALFTSLFTGSKLADVPGVIIVSMTPDVGDELFSFISYTTTHQVPMHMLCLADNQVSLDWLNGTVRDKLKQDVRNKVVTVPGQIPIEEKINEADVASYAPLPAFKVLVVNGRPVKHPGAQLQDHCLPDQVFRIVLHSIFYIYNV
jgi:hypothetical protein